MTSDQSRRPSPEAALLASLAKAARARQRISSRLPALWFFTDETRVSDPFAAIARLPPSSGVVLRHYGVADRPAFLRAAVIACHRHGHRALVAGTAMEARRAGADGRHVPSWQRPLRPASSRIRGRGLLGASVHSMAELQSACAARADLIFLSPAFETASHENARPLGAVQFAALASTAPMAVIALGGINASSARRLRPAGVAGFAAISALIA